MTLTLTPSAANVLDVYNRSTPAAIAEGMSWYNDAHAFALTLCEYKPAKAAGVIAALSPMMSWEMNKRAAGYAFSRLTAEGLGLIGNCAKAERILYGADPLTVLSGNKVRAFYNTILDPTGYSGPTIDRHAFDIAIGRVTDDKTRGILSRKGMYEAFGNVYIEAAKDAGIGAPQMQAVTWVQWRMEKGIG